MPREGKPSNNNKYTCIYNISYIYLYVYYSSVCLSPILLNYRHLPKAPQPTEVGLKNPGWSPFRCGSFCPTVQRNHTSRTDTAWRLDGGVPICSMGLVYLPYIFHRFMVNVVKYTINGAYGHVWGCFYFKRVFFLPFLKLTASSPVKISRERKELSRFPSIFQGQTVSFWEGSRVL